MTLRIALIGNQNSGKTTMFNNLTGSSQKVGNWPGVTIEKIEGTVKGHPDIRIVDLPGVYSLSPYSPEEVVSRDFLIGETPDAVINIVDSANLERNLYLTLQVLDTGMPTVVALNMIDMLRARGEAIDTKGLEETLGCPVVETSALKKEGLGEAVKKAEEIAKGRIIPNRRFSDDLEDTLSKIEELLRPSVSEYDLRWYAVKIFERDEPVLDKFPDIREEADAIISKTEAEAGEDSESIIANERYDTIAAIVKANMKRSGTVSTTDKIDRFVMNKWLALPIFASVMALIYYTAIVLIGLPITEWIDETLIGEWIMPAVTDVLESTDTAEWMVSLTTNGIIGGVGVVLSFLPMMLALFILLAVLDNCGYMSRIAFFMDRIFRRFGLSGKSTIPLLVGSGCSVPGIMASRTIESECERRLTAVTVPFIPCSAKLPVIALIAGAIFSSSWWIAPAAYFMGIAAVFISGLILKQFKEFSGKPAPFIMELPLYRPPHAVSVGQQAGRQTWAFVKRAGTIVLLACVIIWFFASFDRSLGFVGGNIEDSMLASFGNVIAPLFSPLGWNDWEFSVATLTGIMAKENIVATLGILFGADMESSGLGWEILAEHLTTFSALSFLVFNLLCVPCLAAVATIFKELGWKRTGITVAYQCVFAYVVALMIFHIGNAVTGSADIPWLIVSLAAAAMMIFLIVRSGYKEESV